MREKEERKARIASLVGCPNVKRRIDGKSDEDLSQMRKEIKVSLIGHMSKCDDCQEKYGKKLPLLKEE